MSIDWSRAPEWADAVGTNGSHAWICDSGYCFTGIKNPKCHPYKENGYSRDSFRLVERRPWTGEGLPPVGTVCEIRAHKLTEWSEAKIAFCSRNVVVWDWIDEPSINGLCTAYAHAIEIRPIRTPEQIAAEEREAKAKAMYLSIYFAEPADNWDRMPESARETFRKAIDAGWQQVTP